MNRSLLILVLAGLAPSVRAAWVVFDPTVNAQLIMSTAQEVAKFVEVIGKQVEQLRSLQEQVNTLHHYVDLFGDPARVRPASLPDVARDLNTPPAGLGLDGLFGAVDPDQAMRDTGFGLHSAIGTTFITPRGETVGREPVLYRDVAASQRTLANFVAVAADARTRRASLKAELARTAESLARATTDAEVQKLSGTLDVLGTALQSLDHEVSEATASALVQDVAVRAEEVRQRQAHQEEADAQFAETVRAYGRVLRLPSAPVKFPIR